MRHDPPPGNHPDNAVIGKTRVQTELDYWFQAAPPACSVLWLIGSDNDLAAAMTRLTHTLAPVHCQAAACRTGARPPVFADQPGCDRLLEGKLEFAGTAIDTAISSIVRNPSSKTSACEVASVHPEGHDRLWALLAESRGLRPCAALFPGSATPPEDWIWSAARLVLVAGTNMLNRDPHADDGLLQGFLAGTVQAGGIAVIKGGLELCGPGFALTGTEQHINEAEAVFSDAPDLDEHLVRRSLHLAGPWSAQAHLPYQYRPDTGRWTRTTQTQP